ncbi:MAG: 5'-nucleotidase C-terminal domain-containing protein [candidate division WOR-3 bacterium]|nr:MAG: 5'-nucleotidase C-terminal domain-containing protein [candidate division WOR-3 bacterium]
MLRAVLVLFGAALAAWAAEVQHVYILHTNDIHGALLPSEAWWVSRDFPPRLSNGPGALEVIRAFRKQAEEEGYGFLLLDAGDVFKGTPLGDFFRGQAVVDFFNRAGYDAVGVGEYDFALGRKAFEQMVEASDMPWVSANIRVPGADTSPSFLRQHLILERGGIRFGIVGLITSYNNNVIKDSVRGDLKVLDEEKVAGEKIAEMDRLGVDAVIGLTHIGHRYEKRLADNVPGFDVIVGGRSHTALYEPVETPRNHTIVVQAASRLTAVGFLDLAVDTDTRRVVGYDGRLTSLYSEEFPGDPEYQEYLDSLRADAEKDYDEVLGKVRRELVRYEMAESPAGNFVTDAMREYFDADIAVHNSNAIRTNIPEGDVTYRDAYEIDGFDNTLVKGEYSAVQVREMMEIGLNGRYAIFQVSGVRVEYDPGAPFGSRVQSILVNGEPLDSGRRYRVVTNSYVGSGTGEYGVFRAGENVEDTSVPLRDAIARYVRRHSPVDAAVEGRIKRTVR